MFSISSVVYPSVAETCDIALSNSDPTFAAPPTKPVNAVVAAAVAATAAFAAPPTNPVTPLIAPLILLEKPDNPLSAFDVSRDRVATKSNTSMFSPL